MEVEMEGEDWVVHSISAPDGTTLVTDLNKEDGTFATSLGSESTNHNPDERVQYSDVNIQANDPYKGVALRFFLRQKEGNGWRLADAPVDRDAFVHFSNLSMIQSLVDV